MNTSVISFRVPKEQSERLDELAAKRSMKNRNDYMRWLVRQHLAKVPLSVMDDERSVEEMQMDFEEVSQ